MIYNNRLSGQVIEYNQYFNIKSNKPKTLTKQGFFYHFRTIARLCFVTMIKVKT